MQLLGIALGIPVALFGLFKGIYEVRQNRLQRAQELRWKRANAAKELLDDIHKHEFAKNAVRMLDWSGGQATYVLPTGESQSISYGEILAALAKNQTQALSAKEEYVRDCFDWFFYRIDRLEHYVRRELIDFDDIRAIFSLYAAEISKNKNTYTPFLTFHGYDLAQAFLARYRESTAPGPRH